MRDSSHLFVTGPDVIKAVTREEVTQEVFFCTNYFLFLYKKKCYIEWFTFLQELGGAKVHTVKSGVASRAFDDDVAALLHVRNLVGMKIDILFKKKKKKREVNFFFVDFLPASNRAPLPRVYTEDSPTRVSESLNTIVPLDANNPVRYESSFQFFFF